MTTAANLLRGAMTPAFELFAAPVTYSREGVSVELRAAMRDFRGDNLFGSAQIGDRLAIVRCEDFEAAMGSRPQRYDRVTCADGIFSVLDWRVAPPVGEGVFYRLALSGGSR